MVSSNVPSNFLKSVCATFYQDSSVFGTTCMKYVQKDVWKEHFMCAPSYFVCAPLMASTRTA